MENPSYGLKCNSIIPWFELSILHIYVCIFIMHAQKYIHISICTLICVYIKTSVIRETSQKQRNTFHWETISIWHTFYVPISTCTYLKCWLALDDNVSSFGRFGSFSIHTCPLVGPWVHANIKWVLKLHEALTIYRVVWKGLWIALPHQNWLCKINIMAWERSPKQI